MQIGQDRREILSRRIILCLLPPTAGRAQPEPARVFQLLPATFFPTMESKVGSSGQGERNIDDYGSNDDDDGPSHVKHSSRV